MKRETYAVGETVVQETLDNGLKVVLVPKPGFHQSFVTFSTKYGSVDSSFRTNPKEPFMTVPDGIAHFLEHKMFESEQGDVFPQFARYGASANAFTTFDQTSYLFSCTDNLRENTELLLDFVQDPYFTDENVEKEKGIIGQEIQMYNDNPDARIFYELLKGLFVENPVRIEIAGSMESISHITKEHLYTCYNTFYHPNNMEFFAVGGFDPDEMMRWIVDNQAKKSFQPSPQIDRPAQEEPTTVHDARIETVLAVGQPRCLMGWKDAAPSMTGRALLEQELLTGVILDALFGRSSDFYQKGLDDGLIDNQFTWEYERAVEYGFSVIGGNTPDPDKLVEAVQGCLDEAAAQGLPEEDFERSRRKAVGRFFSTLDSPAYVARGYVAYDFRGTNLFDSVSVLEGLTLQQANERLARHFGVDHRAVSIVHG